MNENDKKPTDAMITPRFDHDRLQVTPVLLDALELGVHLANALPRGYGQFADQLRRALQGAWLQTC